MSKSIPGDDALSKSLRRARWPSGSAVNDDQECTIRNRHTHYLILRRVTRTGTTAAVVAPQPMGIMTQSC